jgi:hypothetical protein
LRSALTLSGCSRINCMSSIDQPPDIAHPVDE